MSSIFLTFGLCKRLNHNLKTLTACHRFINLFFNVAKPIIKTGVGPSDHEIENKIRFLNTSSKGTKNLAVLRRGVF